MKHDWRNKGTTSSRVIDEMLANETHWQCANCKAEFFHDYHHVPFEDAIKRANIAKECS